MLKKHERLCVKHDYSHIVMPKEDEKILKNKDIIMERNH